MLKQISKEHDLIVDDERTSNTVAALKQGILDNLFYVVGKRVEVATDMDHFMALAYTVRDRILARWRTTKEDYAKHNVRTVYYLSAEFLMGPYLANNILNLGIEDVIRQAAAELDLDLSHLIGKESEPGLGNGGLGRLAACYLDSLATLGVPAMGYGIRYEFGMFHQAIRDGWQVELTDYWLRYGNPWEIRRPQACVEVGFGGRTQSWSDSFGEYKVLWTPDEVVKGVPFDTPIVGYRSGVANTLRLWRSEANESFYFDRFNSGDYEGAVAAKVFAENISKVLYPNDEEIRGKELRLQQQFLFTSCSLQDMIRRHETAGHSLENFHEQCAVQLNDTHPSIGVAELMRLLIFTVSVGIRRGRSPRTLLITPITRFYRRRSNGGRCRCFSRCFLAISRLSMRLMHVFSALYVQSSQSMRREWPGCLSSTSMVRDMFAWRILRALEARTSTALQNCTQSC
jgi:starch phosphorylase